VSEFENPGMKNIVPQLAGSGRIRSLSYMTAHQNFAFQQLLSAWRRRDDARTAGNLPELAKARIALDSARNDMHASLSGLR